MTPFRDCQAHDSKRRRFVAAWERLRNMVPTRLAP
jgi:hypothetical protein